MELVASCLLTELLLRIYSVSLCFPLSGLLGTLFCGALYSINFICSNFNRYGSEHVYLQRCRFVRYIQGLCCLDFCIHRIISVAFCYTHGLGLAASVPKQHSRCRPPCRNSQFRGDREGRQPVNACNHRVEPLPEPRVAPGGAALTPHRINQMLYTARPGRLTSGCRQAPRARRSTHARLACASISSSFPPDHLRLYSPLPSLYPSSLPLPPFSVLWPSGCALLREDECFLGPPPSAEALPVHCCFDLLDQSSSFHATSLLDDAATRCDLGLHRAGPDGYV